MFWGNGGDWGHRKNLRKFHFYIFEFAEYYLIFIFMTELILPKICYFLIQANVLLGVGTLNSRMGMLSTKKGGIQDFAVLAPSGQMIGSLLRTPQCKSMKEEFSSSKHQIHSIKSSRMHFPIEVNLTNDFLSDF